jgi:hypothetical protein
VDDWRRDLRRSNQAFGRAVYPEIQPYIGGGEYQSLETGDDNLDRMGGIDGYQLFHNGVRTIAQRTQFVDDYRKPATFTVRRTRSSGAVTEAQKRYDAINEGFDLPGLVIQAYVHEEQQQLIRVGVVHGRPFYEWVFRQMDRWSVLYAGSDRNSFLVVPWQAISIDNAKSLSEIPFLGKDGLGVIYRTPIDFFDRHPCYATDLRRRTPGLRWI